MNFLLISLFTTILLFNISSCKTAQEWKSRSIYQILTDRFARSNDDNQPCTNFHNYCGGTFKGIQNNLEYIQGMGFDAIWISPVTANTPGGYHGFWTSNFYEINENFGTTEELKELIDTCHERDIWVMVDIVANHVGYVEWIDSIPTYTQVVPFNDPSYYHPYFSCESVDWKDQSLVEACWLNGLPDLDQNHPFVKDTLLNWARDFVETYNIDALRIDTAAHVSKNFWTEFSRAVGVYTIGEIMSDDLPYLASYQGSLDGVLNYALYSTLRYTFQKGGSMNSIQEYYNGARSTWTDISLLGNFVDKHNHPRFLSGNGNYQVFKSALAFSVCSEGIPIVYYGDEQGYAGGADPANREPLWTNMRNGAEIYEFLKKLNNVRKKTEYYKHQQIQRYSDDQFYAFSRGDVFFAFTNTNDYQSKMISFHPYAEGTQLCNIFHREDCVEVKNGEFPVILINGEVKIFTRVRTETEEPETVSSTWMGIKAALSSSSMFGARSLSQLRF